MKFCVIIPCYNHSDTLGKVLDEIGGKTPVIVVDDGSNPPVSVPLSGIYLLRNEKNKGKAAALKSGFKLAAELGFTHAITLDSDGQHPPRFIGDFIRKASENENNIILGIRNFDEPGVPAARKFMNKLSNICMWCETGVRIADTQCGYRCYPLAKLEKLNIPREGFVFEVELLVKAAWANIKFSEVKIPAIYSLETLSKSHYRPLVDTAKFTFMNIRLLLLRLFTTSKMREKISIKK